MDKRQEGKGQIQDECPYRVIVRQPLSVDGGIIGIVHDLSIQGIACNIVIRPAHAEPEKQRETGGSLLAVEFHGPSDADLLDMARIGFELVEDFLSAIALVTGMPLRQSTLALVSRQLEANTQRNCEFLQFLEVPVNHWPRPISAEALASVKHLVAHWDGLEKGKRMRRGARQYRDAIGNLDDAGAFQEAYIGLEAMEPPLAKMAGLTPGTEETTGECAQCHATFVRKKTTLVGVRSFVLGEKDPAKGTGQRKGDWKTMNELRNNLMHGLIDSQEYGKSVHEGVVSAMHYLHDAICICSHAPELSLEKYQLPRGGTLYAIHGRYTAASMPPLKNFAEPIETSAIRWVSHAMGFVPEVAIKTHGIGDLELAICKLSAPISIARTDLLTEARYERQ